MAITFHVIGTQLNALRALGGGTATLCYDNSVNTAPAVVADAASGVFGASVIQLVHTSAIRAVQWPGGANMPTNSGPITVRVRINPRFTGAPSVACVLWCAEGLGVFNTNTCWFYLDSTSKLNFLIKDTVKATTYVNVTTSVAISPTLTSGTPVEFMVAWDGTTTAGGVKISMNGVQVGVSLTGNATAAAWNQANINYIMAGGSARFTIGNYDLNEMLIDDTAQNTTYTVGSSFVTDTAFDSSTYTNPGIVNVVAPASYYFAGSSYVGTYVSTFPTVTQIASAIFDSSVIEGTLTFRQATMLAVASAAGKLSGAATTSVVIRNTADTKNRISATVDANGNRTAVTYDVT